MHDRDWAIVTDRGVCLNQKREPRLTSIRPSLDLTNQILTLSHVGKNDVHVPIKQGGADDVMIVQGKVCGDRYVQSKVDFKMKKEEINYVKIILKINNE